MSPALGTVRFIESDGVASTRELARRLAQVARPGDVIGLFGELGAGKTEFAKGFGAGLGVAESMSSPSFVLMAEYDGRLPLFHLDLYRLDDAAAALADGLLDEREAAGVTLIEWADRLGAALPAGRLEVLLEVAGDTVRAIRLRATDEAHSRYMEAVG